MLDYINNITNMIKSLGEQTGITVFNVIIFYVNVKIDTE